MVAPYYEEDGITIYNADCRDVLPQLEPVDLVLTDPPYGIQANKAKAHSSIRDNANWPTGTWDNERPGKDTFDMFLLKSRAAAIWGGNYFADLLPASSAWLCWRKPEAETGFSLADIELCWTSGDFAARCKTYARRDGNLHPTQKPLALMKWAISFFSEAQTILDPFMGSGTTLVAAKALGLKAIGIEISKAYCDIAVERLRQRSLFSLPELQEAA